MLFRRWLVTLTQVAAALLGYLLLLQAQPHMEGCWLAYGSHCLRPMAGPSHPVPACPAMPAWALRGVPGVVVATSCGRT